jgi:hypothetical protein
MEKQELTNWQAIGIGCLVGISASLIIWRLPFSVYFVPFVQQFTVWSLPVGIIGALIGKSLWKNWSGSLAVAVIAVYIELELIQAYAGMLALD